MDLHTTFFSKLTISRKTQLNYNERLISEIQFYDADKEDSLYQLQEYYNHDKLNKRRMNKLFRNIKDHISTNLSNKNNDVNSIIKNFVEFVDFEESIERIDTKKNLYSKKVSTRF